MTACVADWEMILKYLSLLLSWPAVTLVCVMGAFFLFRPPIGALIGRLKKATLPGGSVEFDQAAQMALPAPPVPGGAAPTREDLMRAVINEKRLNIIMGSQLILVQTLAGSPDGLTDAEVDIFFQEHRTRVPESPWKITDWLRWPVSAGLVRIDGEGQGKRSRAGRDAVEFVDYVASNYRAPQRWG